MGYGLFYLPNDVALLANTFNTGLLPSGARVFAATELSVALENDCASGCGVETSSSVSPQIYYQACLWKKKQTGSCEYTVFASGFGGITIATLPAGANFYYFSDNSEYDWTDAAEEALILEGTCPR